MKKVFEKINGVNHYLEVYSYCNDTLYIGIVNRRGDLFEDITINLPGIFGLDKNQIFLSTNIPEKIKKSLLDKKIIGETIYIQPYNYGNYELVNVNLDVLKEYDKEGVDAFLQCNKDINEENCNSKNNELER